MELKVGEYIRINGKIGKIKEIILNGNLYEDSGIYLENEKIIIGKEEMNKLKSSENIIDLIEPMDLLFVDIDNGYEGGIIVPRIAETMNELNEIKSKIKSGNLKLKYIITREQIENLKYEVE